MLLLLVMAWTSLELVTTVEGERCGSNNLGFRCQDDGVCWDEVDYLLRLCGDPHLFLSGVCLRWV